MPTDQAWSQLWSQFPLVRSRSEATRDQQGRNRLPHADRPLPHRLRGRRSHRDRVRDPRRPHHLTEQVPRRPGGGPTAGGVRRTGPVRRRASPQARSGFTHSDNPRPSSSTARPRIRVSRPAWVRPAEEAARRSSPCEPMRRSRSSWLLRSGGLPCRDSGRVPRPVATTAPTHVLMRPAWGRMSRWRYSPAG